MSIIESLRKLIDPVNLRQDEEERRILRELPASDDKAPPPPTRFFACRVCRYLGKEPTYCPRCLAGTMQPTDKTPAEPG